MKKVISLLLVITIVFSLAVGFGVNSNALTEVWEKEPNDAEYQPTDFDFGQVMCGNLSGWTDYDYYRITINTTVTFRLKFDHEYPDKAKYNSWGIDIYKYDSYACKYERQLGFTVKESETVKKSKEITAYAGDVFLISIAVSNGPSPLTYMLSLEPVVAKTGGIKCTARTTSAQKVAWNKVPSASGYQVQRSNNGGTSWSSYYSTSGTSYVFSSLTAGGKYKFRVRAYKDVGGTRYYGSWSATLCSCCTPAKPVLRGVSSPKRAQIKTTWSKAGGTKSGYQILYGKNASFSSIAARKNVSSSYSSYIGKNFTKGRTYYVKVRTYTTFGGKAYYSGWSSAKKVKCR